jgi:murein DD-endopeptidase MepM/ murein hydrolase activator NlpD
MFSNCATGTEFASEEPVLVCDEDVFSVFGGVVAEVVPDESASTLGLHVVVEHRWPVSGQKFFTLYAHLRTIAVTAGESLRAGQVVGRMGQTSSSTDARNWMAIAPHLHFEAWDENSNAFDPEKFLRTFLPR